MEIKTLKQIIIEQKEVFEKDRKIIDRVIPENILKSNKIIVITGVRRSGKSTLLRQISKYYEKYNYINFEDDRLLEFTFKDFDALFQAFLELNQNANAFFFDEIQEIFGWEKFARRMFSEGYKLFVTGSNARFLSSEIATSLTGRNLKIEIYPFSFREYLFFLSFDSKETYTTKERAIISRYLEDYLKFGGFPEVIESKDYKELSQIYQDILIKDLLVRFKIRDTKEFRELALYLLSNISKKISYNSLKNLLGFSNTSKVKNYVDFLLEAYLFFTVNKYDVSLKKQLINNRKIYAIDTGLVNAVSFQFSENRGRILENLVFIELKRRNSDIFYFEDQKECDFLIKEGISITKAIQVAFDLSDPATNKRELDGLISAMEKFNLKNGLMITGDKEEKIIYKNRKIEIIPLWKWLLK